MSDRERWIRRHLWLLQGGQFLHRAAEWLAGFLILFGIAVLLSKRLLPAMWPHVLWLLAAAAPLLAGAWWVTRRNRFTREESIALLDRSLGTDGLLMTLTEVPHDEWKTHLPQLEQQWRESLPRLRPTRFASCVALPLLFAVGVCFVPLRVLQSADVPPPQTAGRKAAERLENLLAAVKEAEVLKEEEQQELAKEIEKLIQEAERSPLTHEKWETVDALEQRMRMELRRAELQAEKLSSAANLLAALEQGNGPQLSEEQLEQLEAELLENLQQRENGAAAGTKISAGKLGEMLNKLTKNGTQSARLPTDPKEREQLLNELRDFLEQEQQKLAELRQQCEGGQCKSGTCQNCGGQCQSGALCAECQGLVPGRGGISRGRGDAPLTWGDESDAQGGQFKEAILPKGFLEDPKDEVVKVQMKAPTVDPSAAAPRAAARETDAATGRESVSRKLRPRHKEVVKQFFDSP